MSTFKNNFNPRKEDVDNSLVSRVNQYCPNSSHEHRKATKKEFTQNKLYKYKDTGCYICNPKIDLDSYSLSLSWYCEKFTNKIHHKLSSGQKLIFFMLTKDVNSRYFLPIELVLIIFKKCEYYENSNRINKITPELCRHSKNCKICADNIVSLNTGFSCAHHIISRVPINRYINY